MGEVINLFNHKRVDEAFFSQFTHIQAAIIKHGRLFVRLGVIPVHRRPATKDSEPPKVVIPPRIWIRRLRCDIWDPDNQYRASAEFESAGKQGKYLVFTSAKLHPTMGESLQFSNKAQLMIHGPEDKSLLVKFNDVDVRDKQVKKD